MISRETRLSTVAPANSSSTATAASTGSNSTSKSGGAASSSGSLSSAAPAIKSDPAAGAASDVQTLLRLRLAPHRGDNATEILAECGLDHPFFVKEKGKHHRWPEEGQPEKIRRRGKLMYLRH